MPLLCGGACYCWALPGRWFTCSQTPPAAQAHALQRQTISILKRHCNYKAYPDANSESPSPHFKPNPSRSVSCNDFWPYSLLLERKRIKHANCKMLGQWRNSPQWAFRAGWLSFELRLCSSLTVPLRTHTFLTPLLVLPGGWEAEISSRSSLEVVLRGSS